MCVCVRACVCACVRVCVCACVRACVRPHFCLCLSLFAHVKSRQCVCSHYWSVHPVLLSQKKSSTPNSPFRRIKDDVDISDQRLANNSFEAKVRISALTHVSDVSCMNIIISMTTAWFPWFMG